MYSQKLHQETYWNWKWLIWSNVIGDSLLNIKSRGLSKFKKASVSSHPGATNEDILSAVEESLKTNPDTLIVHAGTNDLTKSTKTLRNAKKYAKKWKESRQVQRLCSVILFIGRTNETLKSSISILIQGSKIICSEIYIPNR